MFAQRLHLAVSDHPWGAVAELKAGYHKQGALSFAMSRRSKWPKVGRICREQISKWIPFKFLDPVGHK